MGRYAASFVVLALVLLGLAGCATMAEKAGIASKKYADTQAAQAAEQAAAGKQELEARLAKLQADLEALQQDAAGMRQAMESVDRIVASMSQMEEIAKDFENRLAGLPEDTLRKLIEILSAYLDRTK